MIKLEEFRQAGSTNISRFHAAILPFISAQVSGQFVPWFPILRSEYHKECASRFVTFLSWMTVLQTL
jgi:hypothetical protein